jgi:hypothetical protein
MDPQPPSDSVTSSLSGFTWSSEESVAYEAAIEAINGAVGAYSARIAAEEAKPTPDQSAVAAWQERQFECARAREGLDPTDHAQIAEARRHFADLAREVREGQA